MKRKFETRTYKSNIELREDEGKRTIVGLIPYNSRSVDMGFYEYITPTAFRKTMSDGADVKALVAHDTSKLIGRVGNGSLRLIDSEQGLICECDLPDTTYANDAYALIRDGYCQTMSFGFRIINEDYSMEEGREVHYLREVKLDEVSYCVTFPAYEATTSAARNIRGIELEKLDEVLAKESLTEEDITYITETINKLSALLPKKEDEAPEEEKKEEPEVKEEESAVNDTEDDELDNQFLSDLLTELQSEFKNKE